MKLATCHPTRKHQARGMCKSCYDKWLKDKNPEYKDSQQSNATKWAKANPEKMAVIKARRKTKEAGNLEIKARIRNGALLRKYGITLNDYHAMLSNQNGGCAICSRKPGEKALHVDHCHTTGVVRGLLCHQCNWYLGTIDADPEIVKRIISYRKRSEPKTGRRKATT